MSFYYNTMHTAELPILVSIKFSQKFEFPTMFNMDNDSLDQEHLTNFRTQLQQYQNGKTMEEMKVKQVLMPVKNNEEPIKDLFINFKLCKVCGEKASGYYYGALSCEICKEFFYSSVFHKYIYAICRDKSSITKLNHIARCDCCRYRKCFEVGMKKLEVRKQVDEENERVRELVREANKCRVKT